MRLESCNIGISKDVFCRSCLVGFMHACVRAVQLRLGFQDSLLVFIDYKLSLLHVCIIYV